MLDNLPPLTSLQFAILNVMGSGTISGKQLRASLAGEYGIKKTGPAFYQLMARLEEAKFVEGWYEQEIIDGQIIKERNYKVLGKGISAMKRTAAFYRSGAIDGWQPETT